MRKKIVLLVIFLLLVVFAGCQKSPETASNKITKTNVPNNIRKPEGNIESPEYKKQKSKADLLLYKEKNLDKAMKIYNNELGKYASNNKQKADIKFRIAEIYLIKGKKDDAIEEYKNGLDIAAIDEQRIYSLSRIAGIYCSQNKTGKAIEYINKAHEIKPPEGKDNYFGKFEMLFSEGTIKADMGEYKDSIKNLRAALEIQPYNYQVMSELAFALMRDYQFEEARKMSDKWLETKKKYDSETDDDKEDEDLVEGEYALHEVRDEECESQFRYHLIHGDYKKADDVLKGYMKEEYDTCLETGYISYFAGDLDKSEKLFKKMSTNEKVIPWERDIAKKMLRDIEKKRAEKKQGRKEGKKQGKISACPGVFWV